MKVWRAIAKTLGCLCCVSNPEASLIQLPPEPPEASSTRPVPEEPAPADAPVDSPNSDATDKSDSESPPGGWQDFKNTATGALRNILKIAKVGSFFCNIVTKLDDRKNASIICEELEQISYRTDTTI